MLVTPKLRLRLGVQNGIFVVLLVVLVALLAFFAYQYRIERDITQNARNTLTPATRDLLAKIAGPITITVYAPPRDPRADVRKRVRDFFAPYQRAKPDLSVAFIDPREEPKLAQAAGIRMSGESVVEYNHKTEHLTDYDEQLFVNALMRMLRSSERLVMGLDGHGERRLNGIANHDLGEFGKQLNARGFKTNGLNLAIAQEVPANANVLVIANPQVDLQPAEVQKIKLYLQKGGNLLWLIDTEPLHGLQPIAELLGLILGPGTVVDPNATKINASPTTALGASYGRHAITDNLRLNTVFPFARQIGVTEGDEWRVTRLIEVAPRGWVEMSQLDGKISFDKARDIPGPVTIAAALERSIHDNVQRVVVIGNGHFLANTFIGNGGNLDLGLNLVNWLAGDENLIAIEPHPTLDVSFELGRGAQYVILFGFLIVLPLIFVAVGVAIWWRRRSA